MITVDQRRCTLGVAVCVLAFTIVGCAARRPVRSFSELPQQLQRGNTVYVLDDGGTETKGKVREIAASALTLDVDGAPKQIGETHIRQVDRYGDSLWNGFFIGAGFGAGVALFSDARYEPCPTQPSQRCKDNQVGLRIASVGLMGAAGAGIDALFRHRNPVYVAPGEPPQRQARVGVFPFFISRGFGVVVTQRFGK